MLERFRSLLGLETHGAGQPYSVIDLANDMGLPGFGGNGIKWNYSVAAALQIPTVLACVRVIAEDVAKLPLRVMEKTDNGLVPVDHELNELLNYTPNDFQTAFEFKETLVMHAVTDRGGFSYINRVRGEIREFLPLQPSMVQRDQDRNYRTLYRVADSRGLLGEFPESKILHLRGPSWDGLTALSIPYQAKTALELARAIEQSQIQFHSKGGRPSGVLSFESELSDDARARVRKQFQQIASVKGTAVLDSRAHYVSLDTSGSDAQTLENREFQIREICRAFRVHPQKIMESAQTTTYASAESFNTAHANDAIAPWVGRLQQLLTNEIRRGGKANAKLRVLIDMDEMKRGTMKERGDYYARMAELRILTRNEVREKLGETTVDGLNDKPFPNEVRLVDQKPKPASQQSSEDEAKRERALARIRSVANV